MIFYYIKIKNNSIFAKQMTHLENHERFILNNWDYFVAMVGFSEFMTLEKIRKYQSVLSWGDLYAISNIKWDKEMFEEFSDYLLEYCYEFFIDDHLTWSVELLNKYKSQLNWDYLILNEKIIQNLEICNAFKPEIKEAMEKNLPCYIDESYIDLILNFTGEKYAEYHLENIIDNVNRNFEETFTKISDVEAFDTLNWDCLSKNTDLPWSVQFIEKYADKFNWYHLSWNETLPWSTEFIAQYEHLWDWKVLSSNSAIAWNEDLIETYKDKLDWKNISENSAIDFTLDFFHKYKERFLNSNIYSIDIAIKSNNFKDKIVIVNNEEIYSYDDYYSLSDFSSIVKWDIETIRQNEKHVNWKAISLNHHMDWTIEILNEFNDELEMGYVCQNKKLWDDVFSVLTEAELDYLMDKIIALKTGNH